MPSRSEEKRKLILAKAELVFIRKGFRSVTMKDIIEECRISRGGIYLYYSSVAEIFMEVVLRHNQINLMAAQRSAKGKQCFETMLNHYLLMQKDRLLHMENSLLPAMLEFFMANKDDAGKAFCAGTFDILGNAIQEVMNRGAEEGYIDRADIRVQADQLLYLIKGLETLAITGDITEALLDIQFEFYKQNLLRKRT